MKLRYKILGTIGVVIAIGVAALALTISYNSACNPAPALADGVTTMKAIVYRCYGSTDVLKLEDVAKPSPASDEVLVKVHSAALNPLDWHYMRGTPYIMRVDTGVGAPKAPQMGVDFAGTVESVGRDVKRFKPGDEVFGGRNGAFAEYVTVREGRAIVSKPANISFEQAAAVPIAAITALQALRDNGKLQAGQKVLINGASGGVGTFAVQIARTFGAEVTGVCSTRNVELVRSLGADHVIDYTQQNFTEGSERYDLVLDMVGNHPLLKIKGVMKPEGIVVIVGGPDGNWLGPLAGPIKALFLSPFISQDFGVLLADMNQKDLTFLHDLMQAGKLTPIIDRRYRLSEVREAIAYLEEGRARGKVVVNMQ